VQYYSSTSISLLDLRPVRELNSVGWDTTFYMQGLGIEHTSFIYLKSKIIIIKLLDKQKKIPKKKFMSFVKTRTRCTKKKKNLMNTINEVIKSNK
jgi:hypothetical protein